MKKLLLLLILFSLISCGGRDNETSLPPTDVTYTKTDAVGTWKATHFENPNNNLGWEVEHNTRSITFKTDDTFTSVMLTESLTNLTGNFTIDTKGYIKTSNLNLTERQLDMNLSNKTNAIITIRSIPTNQVMRKYKVIKL